jgi:hypothetical protein
VKVMVNNDSPAGARTAANTPCRARVANSMPGSTAAPASADAAAKPDNPIMKVRR